MTIMGIQVEWRELQVMLPKENGGDQDESEGFSDRLTTHGSKQSARIEDSAQNSGFSYGKGIDKLAW